MGVLAVGSTLSGTSVAAAAPDAGEDDRSRRIGVLAAPQATGANNGQGGSVNAEEVHSATSAKATVTAQISGSQGAEAPWDHTNSVMLGYSATSVSWNAHDVWEWKSKGGRVFGSDVKSARVQCE
ncbi:hypothetical protein GCM10025867_03460 [Frondihabitans sucicola]|uniref:Uncharacterized protein n=1 Tax=Frondihabitans sucicola TaxID=1268041 RepID=A0ABM8GID1_9MICO|nr:hypothetical protein GCM10025867_03460 [Frondihabitans sucicola]